MMLRRRDGDMICLQTVIDDVIYTHTCRPLNFYFMRRRTIE